MLLPRMEFCSRTWSQNQRTTSTCFLSLVALSEILWIKRGRKNFTSWRIFSMRNPLQSSLLIIQTLVAYCQRALMI